MMIVSAHSMGALAVFHALRQQFESEAVGSEMLRSNERVAVDQTILVNPALSVSEYATLRGLASAMLSLQQQSHPRLVILSSEEDCVTSRLYPVGMMLMGRLRGRKRRQSAITFHIARTT